mmetsp:Transcript_44360/g.72215  ORF Transcript_44360/g.72215 Transcript_44360/m.72215 type:complete len:133 (-) Transcript_44360:895-1293(-)
MNEYLCVGTNMLCAEYFICSRGVIKLPTFKATAQWVAANCTITMSTLYTRSLSSLANRANKSFSSRGDCFEAADPINPGSISEERLRDKLRTQHMDPLLFYNRTGQCPSRDRTQGTLHPTLVLASPTPPRNM